jgi:predicted membrane chloride channel (bestrophin family)
VVHGDVNADVLLLWRMTSFILALLLAFRINKVYMRWQAGVQAFGGVGSAAVTLSQQAAVWVPDPVLQVSIPRLVGFF